MSTRRVLVIDDEADIREVATSSLQLVGGWQVHSAESGAAGLHTAAQVQPDAVLLDVMMPDMDGPATLARLRTDPRTASIPVIFLTAKNGTSEHLGYAALGAAGVICKPFDPMTLPATVAAALGWPQ